MKAVMVDKEQRLVLADVGEPIPHDSEVLVRVRSVSINRGEVRRALSAPEGARPGWDFAGTIERAAADGSGPKNGARVVGIMPTGAWAQLLAARTDMIAALPEDVQFGEAACLPVAGLTALHAIRQRGDLLSRNVLITGASGGVGHFACQLAALAGARVVAAVRSEAHVGFAKAHGAHEAIVVHDDPAKAEKLGPFDLILDSVGGESLGASARMLAPDGVCVTIGVSAGPEARIAVSPFYMTGGASIYGLALFHELARRERASVGLARLVSLLVEKKLRVHVAVERPWDHVAEVARDLLERRYPGKAVLHLV